MRNRLGTIDRLIVGDIFHATCSNGANLICMVETITDTTVGARTMAHQIKMEFDRKTGVEIGAKSELIS